MSFLIVGGLLSLMWYISHPRHLLLSVGFANFAGVLMFVALGIELHPYDDGFLAASFVLIFYGVLVVGEILGRKQRLPENRLGRVGNLLLADRRMRFALILVFLAAAWMPILMIIVRGDSLTESLRVIWSTDGLAERASQLIADSQRTRTGFEALAVGLQIQVAGLWYLSVGIASASRSRLLYPTLMAYIVGAFVTSDGSRTLAMLSLTFPVVLWAQSHKISKTQMALGMAVLAVCTLLLMDILVLGRQGVSAEGELTQRFERALKTDFAYGGLGLRLGLDPGVSTMISGVDHASWMTAASHLARIAILPIPRVLWPDKPSSNPNQELTEWYTGLPLSETGSIYLFTPLGEALFYFGIAGLLIVPLLYGYTTVLLERVFSTSPSYRGLLAQLVIWSFVSMRLTYFNLFSMLIAANFLALLVLALGVLGLSERKHENAPRESMV